RSRPRGRYKCLASAVFILGGGQTIVNGECATLALSRVVPNSQVNGLETHSLSESR
ncbi:6275_t:CDS:1, partial [Acaulospora colombiana]